MATVLQFDQQQRAAAAPGRTQNNDCGCGLNQALCVARRQPDVGDHGIVGIVRVNGDRSARAGGLRSR